MATSTHLQFQKIKKRGNSVEADASYFRRVISLFSESYDSDENFIYTDSFKLYKRWYSIKNQRQGMIWGGQSQKKKAM